MNVASVVSAPAQKKLTCLTDVQEGARVRLQQIEGSEALRMRLASMGLSPGVAMDVLRSGSGPCLLAVRQSRIALGRAVARKVRVSLEAAER